MGGGERTVLTDPVRQVSDWLEYDRSRTSISLYSIRSLDCKLRSSSGELIFMIRNPLEMTALICEDGSSGLVSDLLGLHTSATDRINRQFADLRRMLAQKQAEQLEMLDLVWRTTIHLCVNALL